MAVLMMAFGIPAILVSPAVPLVLFFIGWPVLAALKRGKPEGFMIHLFYRLGVPFSGLLPPGEGRYSAYGAVDDIRGWDYE